MLQGVHTIIAEVQDMDRAIAFYCGLLGLPSDYQSPHWSSLSLGSIRLGLHPPFAGAAANRGGWVLGVETLDIEALKAKLHAEGFETGAYHDTPSGVVMDFKDPDGNRLQAIQVGMKAADL